MELVAVVVVAFICSVARVLCRLASKKDELTNSESLSQEEDCFHECKHCEIEERIEAVMSRSLSRSGQQLSQRAACPTLSVDSPAHSTNYNKLNSSDSGLETEAPRPPVMSEHAHTPVLFNLPVFPHLLHVRLVPTGCVQILGSHGI